MTGMREFGMNKMPIDMMQPGNANKPTAANNLAEREEQVAAITARAMRLRASPMSPSSSRFPDTSKTQRRDIGQSPSARAEPSSKAVVMEPSEAQARASIAAALIIRGAVELPAVPQLSRLPDEAGMRLRELTDYVYRLVTMQTADPLTVNDPPGRSEPPDAVAARAAENGRE